jgi:hypothetical protein
MRQARLIKRVEPVYPPEAKVRRIEGVVTLSVIIGKDGSVKILQVLAGDPVLSPAQWMPFDGGCTSRFYPMANLSKSKPR